MKSLKMHFIIQYDDYEIVGSFLYGNNFFMFMNRLFSSIKNRVKLY
jgi:hypothetical protein